MLSPVEAVEGADPLGQAGEVELMHFLEMVAHAEPPDLRLTHPG
jgi:hypothetical protein